MCNYTYTEQADTEWKEDIQMQFKNQQVCSWFEFLIHFWLQYRNKSGLIHFWLQYRNKSG